MKKYRLLSSVALMTLVSTGCQIKTSSPDGGQPAPKSDKPKTETATTPTTDPKPAVCQPVDNTPKEGWLDVTTGSDNKSASTCDQTPNNCSFKDYKTGLEYSKTLPTQYNYSDSVYGCSGLTYNGKSDWRLPSPDELTKTSTGEVKGEKLMKDAVSMYGWGPSFWVEGTYEYMGGEYRATHVTGNYVNQDITSRQYNVICVRKP